MESLATYLKRFYHRLMAARFEAAPPAHVVEAARREMAAMHRAIDQGDHATALMHLRALAGLVGVDWADVAPELVPAAHPALLVADG